MIRLGGCPGWFEFAGRTVFLLVLSCRGSSVLNSVTSSIFMITFKLVDAYHCSFSLSCQVVKHERGNVIFSGLGPMPWTINSEIYPTWARSTGNAMSTTTNWVFNLFVSLTFLTLMENITKYGKHMKWQNVHHIEWNYSGVLIVLLLWSVFQLNFGKLCSSITR